MHHRAEDLRTIHTAKSRVRCTIRMRHEAKHVSLATADACDVFGRPIWICFRHNATFVVSVTQNHLSICVQLAQRRCVCVETAFAVRYRQSKKGPLWATVSEG